MALPRVNSRTPLQSSTRTSPPWSQTTMSVFPVTAYLMATLHPRKPKYRTTFVALLVLVCLSVYIFVAHLSPSMALRHSDSPAADQLAIALETIQNSRVAPGTAEVTNKHRLGKGHRHNISPPLRLSPPQEFAAITSFLASLPQNVIPHTVDPARPIDPQLVLDFDTRGHRAQEEVQAMMDDVWTRNPVFLYSKVCTWPNSVYLPKINSGLLEILFRIAGAQGYAGHLESQTCSNNN